MKLNTSNVEGAPAGAVQRVVRPRARTFEHFPEEADMKCPVCGTNDDGETVLVPIVGTGDGRICEAQCVHLACCVPDHYDKKHGLLYKRVA